MLRVKVNRDAFERIRPAGDLLRITPGDMATKVLARMSAEHRAQEAKIFSSEGAAGGAGAWEPLSPAYAARKRAAMTVGRRARREQKKAATAAGKVAALLGFGSVPRAQHSPISMKILVWSGAMKDAFTKAGNPKNIARLIIEGLGKYRFQFGADSKIASYHQAGGGTLPKRDMVAKTPAQVDALLQTIVDWYRKERVPQALRYLRRFGGRLTAGGGGAPGRAANPAP